ncbi:hypothetical protein [Aneurinibacillus aneurinilyticus]|jgi:hypothetical protein|uniref:Uncharacterized protein n=2 Tax=Aneurinibacillus aneurinilyticus TaxID=1391 RepID=A0A848CP16_ANEAE|nr:hypothetical protein [Aneurinibacillus aneurinilyticus]ERI05021.1 hypothetical protein HMPREF0083_05830 [Aneurinibacillus aneurinilyticus ATCC 12856]MCI1693607.1 hypothetical protein [Aneurinibacillus aneurinilyticus]MED0669122.1 hypothetical protein [Aneurinibacillus aneurinilyticus]MED0708742.1 hypothetical protein [Aneurinibacillus aneurinilyticus]MED0724297.1 hypothetical protein [Aneurinibacillus aneurinilyticus]
MDTKHTQTVLSYCAELSRYAALIKQELTKPSSVESKKQEQETGREAGVGGTAFFTYSVILPDNGEEETDVLVMGDFIVKNTGSEPLHAPMICIRISPAEAGTLSGKIRTNKRRSSFFIEANHANEWHYVGQDEVERKKANGEYWLAPNFCNELAAGESLAFSNFTLSLSKPPEPNSIIVEGFAYFKEQSEGIFSLNNIVINF